MVWGFIYCCCCFSFSFFWLLALDWGQDDMSNYAASVDRKTGRSHLFLSRGPRKGTPVFRKVGGKFSLPISCSFSFLVLTQDLPHSWHCTATSMIKSHLPQENTEFWARGTRKREPLLSKECEEIPLFSVSLFPLFWGQHRFHRTVEKAQEASTPSFWERNWEKTGHCEPKCDWDTREKRLEVRIPWGLSAWTNIRSRLTFKVGTWRQDPKKERKGSQK